MSDNLDILITRVADATRVVDRARETLNAAEAAHREARKNLDAADQELHSAIHQRVTAEVSPDAAG